MKNAIAPMIAASAVLALVALFACEDDDVGIPCKLGAIPDGGGGSGSLISPQSMDCRSRLCLYYGGVEESRPLCTKICDSDDDCPDETETCPDGFTCIPATETTTLACCKMCVCKRFVTGSDAGIGVSAFCKNVSPDCPEL